MVHDHFGNLLQCNYIHTCTVLSVPSYTVIQSSALQLVPHPTHSIVSDHFGDYPNHTEAIVFYVQHDFAPPRRIRSNVSAHAPYTLYIPKT